MRLLSTSPSLGRYHDIAASGVGDCLIILGFHLHFFVIGDRGFPDAAILLLAAARQSGVWHHPNFSSASGQSIAHRLAASSRCVCDVVLLFDRCSCFCHLALSSAGGVFRQQHSASAGILVVLGDFVADGFDRVFIRFFFSSDIVTVAGGGCYGRISLIFGHHAIAGFLCLLIGIQLCLTLAAESFCLTP